MQPYQAATEEIRRQGQLPKKALGTAVAIGASLAGTNALTSRILPFLSSYVPGNLMRKGLEKVSPRIGKFVDTAINNGFSLDEVRDFLSSKFADGSAERPQETQSQTSPEINQHNTLQDFETNYPDIAGALARTMQNGQSPQAAAAIIKQSSPFSKSIKKLESDVGKNFVDYVIELFGNQEPLNQPQQMQQPSQEQMQGGGIDQQLMAALDKILKM